MVIGIAFAVLIVAAFFVCWITWPARDADRRSVRAERRRLRALNPRR